MKPTTEHGNIELTEAQAKIVGVQRQPGGWRSLELVRRIWVAHPLGFGLSKGAGLESTSCLTSHRLRLPLILLFPVRLSSTETIQSP